MREVRDIATLSGRVMCIFNSKKASGIYERTLPAAALRLFKIIQFWVWDLEVAVVVPKRKTAGHTRMGVYYSYIRIFQLRKKKFFLAGVNFQKKKSTSTVQVLWTFNFKINMAITFTVHTPNYSCHLCTPRTSKKVEPINIFRGNLRKKQESWGHLIPLGGSGCVRTPLALTSMKKVGHSNRISQGDLFTPHLSLLRWNATSLSALLGTAGAGWHPRAARSFG